VFKTVPLFTAYEITVNGDMALAKGKGQSTRVAVPYTNMLLRERITRLMGKAVNVSWKSLPEVKSSGLLGKLRRWRFMANN
jgi:hypothetical protein